MTKEEFAGYGFAAGDVRGTRAWKVDRLGRLTGVTYPQVWTPGVNIAECKRARQKEAVPHAYNSAPSYEMVCSCGVRSCDKYKNSLSFTHRADYQLNYATISSSSFFMALGLGETEPHPCEGMDPECGCGLYAYQEGSNDYYKPTESTPVGGVVKGYGRTILGTRGFRAEKAEIVALFVDCSDVSRIGMKLRLQHLYAGVPMFTNYEQMLTEFPPTPPEGASPADDDFWTRKAL